MTPIEQAQRDRLSRAFKFRPVENLTVDEWADRYRVLALGTASVPGPFLTSRVEVARGPMRAMTEPGVRTITMKTCTQLLKTTCLENLLGYLIHQRPCPVLAAFPKVDMVKSFSKERLSPMVRATPALRAIMGTEVNDRSLESLSYRPFPGGFLAMESAGSPTNLAARPIRVTVADEVDKMEDLKFEGDPLLLLEERTSTFPDSLHLRGCSPTIEGRSRIDNSYNESDMRRPFVACPMCGHWQILTFFKSALGGALVNWDKSDDDKEHFPTTAKLTCESCDEQWSEDQRRKMITTKGAIRWQQTKPFICCGVEQEPLKTREWEWDEEAQCGYACCEKCWKRTLDNTHAGFTASKLYSPHITIASIAENWLKVKDDLAQRQVFYNTVLGEAFTADASKRIESHALAGRLEDFGEELDARIIRLTCGVDTQGDRLECHVVGWANPEEAWSVDYEIIMGNPGDPATWKKLDEFLRRRWQHRLGVMLPISATCVDSGSNEFTEMVYRFCQPRASQNVWAIKGSSWARTGDPVWPVPKSTKTRDWGYKPFIIAVNSAKDHLRQMLSVEEHGPGFFHIPKERTLGWLEQLTNERAVFEKKAGVTVRKWHLPRGLANEAWDTLVYAYAAFCGLKAVRGLNMERAAAHFERQALARRATEEANDAGPTIPHATPGAMRPKPKPKKAHSAWL